MPPNKSKRSTEDSPEERRSKRKKPNEDDDEEERDRDSVSKATSSKKTPVFSGGGSSHKPAELFRKDLISAMKLADSEPLSAEDYFLITDQWRQEWERGVQVPVNEIAIPLVDLKEAGESSKTAGDFKIPKKFLHAAKDETYQLGQHELTGMSQLAEQVVRYDLDDLDVSWLEQVNEMREEVGQPVIYEWTMERVVEALENNCHENMEIKKKTEEGLGIEYDEDIVCEICQSPDSEDTNEMVFCDGCDICVHQACYGIQTVPEGSWLCRTCALGIKPQCILCPKVGGAMKSTRSGTKWAHVSCAIWIPEVTIGCVEKMEPITKISQIPASRWSLVCVICKERCGACIQCSVKACKTAFHVTCAISEKLEMKTLLIEDKNAEDVKLKAYCPKHCKRRERNNSESDPDSPRKSGCGTPLKEKEMSEEEKATLRADRLHKLEDMFYTCVEIPEVAKLLELDVNVIDLIFNYWKLKRKSLFNRPLLTPKTEEEDLLEKQQEDSLVARMKMFVHLRQDLERVRNLSYMISKREKLKRQFSRSRESVFYAVLEVLTDKSLNLGKREVDKIVKTYRDLPSPYDEHTAKKIKMTKSTTKIEEEEIDDDVSEISVPVSVSVETKKVGKVSCVKSEIKRRKAIHDTPKSRFSSKTDSNRGTSKERSSSTPDSVSKDCDQLAVHVKEEPMEESDLNNSCDVNSDIVDVINDTDNTLVNVSQTSTTDGLAKPESESLASPQPGKRKRGRPSLASLGKQKELTGETEKTPKSEEAVIKSSDKEHDIEDCEEKGKPVSKRRQTRSSLPGTLLNTDVTDTQSVADTCIVIDDSVDVVKIEQECVQSEVVDKVKDRRTSASHRLSEGEKQDIVTRFPSAKKVSDHLKAELHGYFKNNKLLVGKSLREKVQNSLLSGRRRSRRTNGVIIDHSQAKIDSFFVKSPPHYGMSEKSPAKNVSRVLNELSPTRDRFEANNVEKTNSLRSGGKVSERSPDLRNVRNGYEHGIFSVREKLFDTDSRHSRSRASTPDSCIGSVKSVSSYKSDRMEKILTRSKSPVVSEDDTEVDLENLCDEPRRVTRSHDSPSRHGSMSPKTVQKAQNIIS